MFTIIIQEKGGEQRRMVFNKAEVTIGRVQGNDIVLPKGNVSKRHARIVLKDGKFIIVDLKSTNGTYVNGRKITSPLVVKDSDKIYIGDFIVGVDDAETGDEPMETTSPPPGGMGLSPPMGSMGPMGMSNSSPVGSATHAQVPGLGSQGPGFGGFTGPPTDPRLAAPDARPDARSESRPDGRPSMQAHNNQGMPQGMAVPSMPPMGPDSGPGQPTLRPGPPRQSPINRDPTTADRPPNTMPVASRDPNNLPPLSPPSPNRALGRSPASVPPLSAPMGGNPVGNPLGGPTIPEADRLHTDASGPSLGARGPVGMPAAGGLAGPAGPIGTAPSVAPSLASPVNVPVVGAPNPLIAMTPAPVVPLSQANPAAAKRGLVGTGAKRVIGRPIASPGRRGVRIEPLDPKVVKMLDLQSNLLERLRAKLDIDKIPVERLHEEELWQRAERVTIDLVETLESSGELPKYIDQDTLIKETLSEALALGPLEDLLAEEKIDEIIIDRRDRVVVGKDGQLRGSGKAFSSDEMFEVVVKRLVAEAGAVLDDMHPIVDLRMRDGTRLTAAVSPVTTRGACLVLRKPKPAMLQLAELVQSNVLSPAMSEFLATCVTARRNILVCGGPNSGKTQLIAALATASPAGERVISIEDVAELSLARDEWVQLETRPATSSHPAVELGQLLQTALRLGADRLIVGDVHSEGSLTLLDLLGSSVDGAVVGVSSEGAHGALHRLATVARTGSGAVAGEAAVRDLVAQAFEIVVHVTRWNDGSLKILAIEEVVGSTDNGFETQGLFAFRDGSFGATGAVPRFYGDLESRGLPADQAVFR